MCVVIASLLSFPSLPPSFLARPLSCLILHHQNIRSFPRAKHTVFSTILRRASDTRDIYSQSQKSFNVHSGSFPLNSRGIFGPNQCASNTRHISVPKKLQNKKQFCPVCTFANHTQNLLRCLRACKNTLLRSVYFGKSYAKFAPMLTRMQKLHFVRCV